MVAVLLLELLSQTQVIILPWQIAVLPQHTVITGTLCRSSNTAIILHLAHTGVHQMAYDLLEQKKEVQEKRGYLPADYFC